MENDDEISEAERAFAAHLQLLNPEDAAAEIRKYGEHYLQQRSGRVMAGAVTEAALRDSRISTWAIYGPSVLSDPFLLQKAEDEFNLLGQTHPDMQISDAMERAVRTVTRKYGSADSRAIEQIRRDRSHGARGRKNPNLMLEDDSGGEGATAEQLADEEYQRHLHEGVVEIHGMRRGRLVEANPEFGRNQVQRQRDARVAERERAYHDTSEE